jgi:hypothetical protein
MEDLQQSKRGKPRQGFPIDIVRTLSGLHLAVQVQSAFHSIFANMK